jgi:trafficking protein particle complex subunit 10
VCNSIVFVHENPKEAESLIEQSKVQSVRPRVSNILCYPRYNGFDVKIHPSRRIHIDQTRCLEIDCTNGPVTLDNGELKLKSASSGLRLHIADATVMSGDSIISTKASPGIIMIRHLQQHSNIRIRVPYELDDSHQDISIRIDVSSKSSNLEYTSIETVRVELPLDVNVHDLFKSGYIFSRFNIKTATAYPLKLINLRVEGTEDFRVESPSHIPFPTIVHAKQMATFMYKIYPRQSNENGDSPRKLPSKEKPLTLNVDYLCIEEEIQWYIVHKFQVDLEDSSFQALSKLLIRFFANRIQFVSGPQTCSDYTLTNQIMLPTFEEVSWISVLNDLPPQLAQNLKTWLRHWHETNSLLSIPEGQSSGGSGPESLQRESRHIIITVPLPRLHAQHCVSFRLNLQNENDPVPVGSPITATMEIIHTRSWESPSAFEELTAESSNLEFMYDVDAPLDAWAIGGARRGRYFAKADEVKSWTLVLIPLKTGKLLLPGVDVRPCGKDSEALTSETDFKEVGRTILVIGNLKTTTIAMTGSKAILRSAQKA